MLVGVTHDDTEAHAREAGREGLAAAGVPRRRWRHEPARGRRRRRGARDQPVHAVRRHHAGRRPSWGDAGPTRAGGATGRRVLRRAADLGVPLPPAASAPTCRSRSSTTARSPILLERSLADTAPFRTEPNTCTLRRMAPATGVDDLLGGLNPVQHEAVIAPDGPLLVVAGAGSGKTRVLTPGSRTSIAERKVSPFQILAITFTNKAAGEMKERVAALVGPVARRMWVATFHSACSRILRREAEHARHTGRRSRSTTSPTPCASPTTCAATSTSTRSGSRPASCTARISAMKNELVLPEDTPPRRSTPPEKRLAEGLHRVPAPPARRVGRRLRRPARARRAPVPRAPRRARALAAAVPPRARRRVPGHEPRPVGARPDARRRSTATSWSSATPTSACARHRGHDGRRHAPKPIEAVAVGDEVLSNYGSGDFRPARVSAYATRRAVDGVTITLASGRELTSTPEHIHFAGYLPVSVRIRGVLTPGARRRHEVLRWRRRRRRIAS